MAEKEKQTKELDKNVKLFLCGDVMLGRGIDQILPYSVHPRIYEGYMTSAKGYVDLAIRKNGPIPAERPVNYVWGDSIKEFEEQKPDAKLINLETAVTLSDDYWKNKGCNYRMHPKNVEVITSAGIDFCSLANNHVLDWGYAGLAETLATLKAANLKVSGAGLNLEEAKAPGIIELPFRKARVLAFSMSSDDCGVPTSWRAGPDKPGVNLINLSHQTVTQLKEAIQKIKKERDIVIASIHWGGNWGFEIEPIHREFAHSLIDEAKVDVIHGHSSHHIKGIEVYKKKLIIYGCGDFIDDYEGIAGYEYFRGDLGLMYFPSINVTTGELSSMVMTPTKTKNLRVNRVFNKQELMWFQTTMKRECGKLGTSVQLDTDNRLKLVFE